MTSFLEDLKSGKAKLEDIPKYTNLWHNSKEDLDYEKFMGMTLQDIVDWTFNKKIPYYVLEAAMTSKQKPTKNSDQFKNTFLEDLRSNKAKSNDLATFIEKWHSSDDPRNLEDAIGISKESLDNWSRNHITPPEILVIEDKIQKTSERIRKLKARKEVYKELLKRNKIDE